MDFQRARSSTVWRGSELETLSLNWKFGWSML
jgi:hypothetical protein